MRIGVVITIAMALITTQATAADWVRISSNDKFNLLIDAGSVAPRGVHRQAWFIWDYFQDQKTDTYPPQIYRSAKQLVLFNCADRRTATIYDLSYSGDAGEGDVVQSRSANANSVGFLDVVPDSFGETMLRTVCAIKLSRNAPPKGR